MTKPADRLTVNPARHCLGGVPFCPSPNADARPTGHWPALVVIHGISLPPGVFGGEAVTDLFLNRLTPRSQPPLDALAKLRVSAHLFLRRDGGLIQFVPFDLRAWHAGRSSYRGRPECNDYSIGIELEGTDQTPYTDAQYAQLVAVLRALWAAYPSLPVQALAGHSEVAPGRKTDPGPAFAWHQLEHLLDQACGGWPGRWTAVP